MSWVTGKRRRINAHCTWRPDKGKACLRRVKSGIWNRFEIQALAEWMECFPWFRIIRKMLTKRQVDRLLNCGRQLLEKQNWPMKHWMDIARSLQILHGYTVDRYPWRLTLPGSGDPMHSIKIFPYEPRLSGISWLENLLLNQPKDSSWFAYVLSPFRIFISLKYWSMAEIGGRWKFSVWNIVVKSERSPWVNCFYGIDPWDGLDAMIQYNSTPISPVRISSKWAVFFNFSAAGC